MPPAPEPIAPRMILRRSLSATLLVLLVGVAPGCASAPPVRPASWQRGDLSYAADDIDWAVRTSMAQHHVRALSIVVVDDHRTLFARGYGWADPARAVPATVDTVYRIGSVSKVLTSALALSLVEQGRLDLDAPVSTYEPAFSIHSRFPPAPITMRGLLSHHAGLPPNVLHGMWSDAPAPLSAIPSLLSEESLVAAPGTMFQYSNIGFALAGRVIEDVARIPFATFATRTLFAPLEMTSTSYEHEPALMAGLATGFAGDRVQPPVPLRDAPAGAVLSTAQDLGRFVQMLLSHGTLGEARVLSPESVETLFRPAYDRRPLDFGHVVGLDWRIGGIEVRGADEPVAWHNGFAPPFQAHVALLRGARLGVVILSNTAEAALTPLGVRVLERMRESQTGVTLTETREEDPAPVAVSHAALDRLVGTYVGLGAERVRIVRDGDRLRAGIFGREMQLLPLGNDTFALRATAFFGLLGRTLGGLRVGFSEAEGRQVAVLRGANGTHVVFERVRPTAIPDAWRNRLGRYTADTTGDRFRFESITLGVDEDGLTLTAVVQPQDGTPASTRTLLVLPVDDTEAVVAGIGDFSASVRAEQRSEGEVLHYSGYVLHR